MDVLVADNDIPALLLRGLALEDRDAKNNTSSMSDFLREFKQATADSRAGRARSRSLCASSAIAFVAAALHRVQTREDRACMKHYDTQGDARKMAARLSR